MSLLDATSLPVLIVAALAASCCALIGSFLVLRRSALLGDAISHGILPGIVVGFALSGSREIVPMFLGALVAALGTTLLTDLLHRRLRIDGDAAMGVVFTTLFALGVVLLEVYAGRVDLDPGCVLHGQVEYAAIDPASFAILGWTPPRGAVTLGVTLLLDLVFVLLLWKELLITSFDGDLAHSLGIPPGPLHLALMGMTALTTVASFEAVGSILVVAMLIVPAMVATLLTDRLLGVLLAAQGVALASAGLGLWSAQRLDTSVAGMMAVSVGGLLAVAFLLAPGQGWLPRRLRRLSLAIRIAEEDLLGSLYRAEERQAGGGGIERPSGAPPHHPAWLRIGAGLRLRWRAEVVKSDRTLTLTQRGRGRGRRLVRRHRLWENYLSDLLALPASHLHDPAHRIEHFLDEELTRRIEERLDGPERDPHGRAIPAADHEPGEEER